MNETMNSYRANPDFGVGGIPFDDNKHRVMANRTSSVVSGKVKLPFMRDQPFSEQPRIIDHMKKNINVLKE